MNKSEFLSNLDSLLKVIPEEDRKDILYDYEEHFRIGMDQGKTEEEIAQALGNVHTISRQFIADYSLKAAEDKASTKNVLNAVFAVALLGFFNLVFVLGPFIGIAAAIISLFTPGIALIASGVALGVMTFLSPFMPGLIDNSINPIGSTAIAIGLTSLGLLFFIGNCYVTKFFFRLTVKYLKWNLNFIKK